MHYGRITWLAPRVTFDGVYLAPPETTGKSHSGLHTREQTSSAISADNRPGSSISLRHVHYGRVTWLAPRVTFDGSGRQLVAISQAGQPHLGLLK